MVDPTGENLTLLRAVPPCRRTYFYTTFQATFPNFEGPDLLPVLFAMAEELKTDIGPVESHWATIRRRLVAASVQTHSQAFECVAADYLADCIARHEDKPTVVKK